MASLHIKSCNEYVVHVFIANDQPIKTRFKKIKKKKERTKNINKKVSFTINFEHNIKRLKKYSSKL